MIQRHVCACVSEYVRACMNAHAYAIEGDRRTDFGRTVFHNWEDRIDVNSHISEMPNAI